MGWRRNKRKKETKKRVKRKQNFKKASMTLYRQPNENYILES